MIYPIVKFGDPVLEREGETVTEFDTPELHKFLEDMFESMYAAKGVGLAAPQIGFGRKIAVIDVSNGQNPEEKLVIINQAIAAEPLYGRLYILHLSALKRELMKRKIVKMQRAGEWD